RADYLVELGPKGGEEGGYLMHAGDPNKIFEKKTPTGEALSSLTQKRSLQSKKTHFKSFLEIRKAKKFNLKEVSASIPYEAITVITGVSGSGKSTFLEEILYKGLTSLKEDKPFEEAEKFINFSPNTQVLLLTQEPLTRSPRSVIATYVGLFPYIRKLMASTEEAKKFGYSESFFSLNSEASQCPNCKGLGYEIVEMQFLPDLYIPCEVCKGKRFREEVLEVKWRGKNIAEILDLTINEARDFFGNHKEIRKILEILINLGLDYLLLGQPLSTLSGGEAQRLKIAELLVSLGTQKAIILLDEPSVGLHLKDINKLLSTLNYLKEKGHTIVIVEHHPEIILSADWILEFGPEGGEKGGYLLYQGPLKEFLNSSCPTATFLKEYIEGKSFMSSTDTKETIEREAEVIRLRGVRHHNLQNIDLDLPRGKFITITGLSGSGKSTLAFDVLFSEGQRRFLETLPAYLRQFFKLHEEIDYDHISGLPATVALEQRSGELSPRSTVGTLTEILPYLRLLYARLSKSYCPSCGKEIKPLSKEELIRLAEDLWDREKKEREILAPIVRHRKGHFRPLLVSLLKKGYHRVRIDNKFYQMPPIPELSRFKEHNIDLFIGKAHSKDSFLELIEKALIEGKGTVILLDPEQKELHLSLKRTCSECAITLPEPDPLLFAFNTKVGACPVCEGLGRWEDTICSACQGTRYRKEVFYYKINNLSLPELCSLSIDKIFSFIKNLQFEGKEKILAEPLIPEILTRLHYLMDLGLSYLTLDRSADTLSSGEAKRVRISAEIGSNLTGVAYILDEPTIGLHSKDTAKLISVLKKLKEKGNTIIVVEHDEEVILESDYILDLGPGGGKKGGKVIYAGDTKDFLTCRDSLTAMVLKDKKRKTLKSRFREAKEFLYLKGVTHRNLKNLEVKIPLGLLTCVVGVSGSGKSSLICEVLYENLKRLLNKEKKALFGIKALEGYEKIKEVYLVDHSPIGNTPRSVPATYIQVFDEIRKAFANTLKAREKGYKEGRFSFNTPEGQCPYCKGQGKIKVEIKFLPSLYQTCEYCEGKRYNAETLEVYLKGKNIAEVLDMDFATARDFFKDYPQIHHKLSLVCQIGLDYLTLGQPSPSLSGGEAQRIKLAKELGKSHNKPVLYLLDEPTTGLHILDIIKLESVLQALVDKGHSVVVIEHNLELIKSADWIIELGPEGGDKGGEILFQGPIKDFLNIDTPTSLALKKYLFSL
ncbi:MAG: excinuclease ABC subunit A, partial [Caldimicrobium sp.]